VAIALGGGGARGLAHFGVLRVFEQAGIPIDCLAGTSMGALIGALYALYPKCDDLYEILQSFLESSIYKQARFARLVQKPQSTSQHFWTQLSKLLKKRLVINLAQSRMSLVSRKRVEDIFDFFLKDKTFNDLKLPFVAASVDLVTGKEVLHTKGKLLTAVMASSAVPGFLPPVFKNGQILVDGVVLNPVPVLPAKLIGGEIIIAVDVGKEFSPQASIENVIDIVLRTHLITANQNNQLLLENADVVLQPAVGHYHWAEFYKYEEIIQAGEKVAHEMLPTVRNLLHSTSEITKKRVVHHYQTADKSKNKLSVGNLGL